MPRPLLVREARMQKQLAGKERVLFKKQVELQKLKRDIRAEDISARVAELQETIAGLKEKNKQVRAWLIALRKKRIEQMKTQPKE